MFKDLKRRGNCEPGFPKLLSYKEVPESAEIILNALGPNLRTLMKQCPYGKFSPPTCFKLIYELIKRIRTLHGMGFVHNDIKPENLVVGHQDSDRIYLIDFGLASRYILKSG